MSRPSFSYRLDLGPESRQENSWTNEAFAHWDYSYPDLFNQENHRDKEEEDQNEKDDEKDEERPAMSTRRQTGTSMLGVAGTVPGMRSSLSSSSTLSSLGVTGTLPLICRTSEYLGSPDALGTL